MLAILASELGRSFSQERLSDALWPNASSEKSKANLRGRVSKVRRALEPHLAEGSDSRYIRLEQGRYCLAKVPELEVDLEEFFQKSQQGVIAFERQDQEHAMGLLREALGLYKSGFLPEFSVQEWTLDWQQRCQEALCRSLGALAQCYEQLGKHSPAVELWLRAFQLEPGNEETALRLMRCQLLLGRRQEALGAFERCRQSLAEQNAVPAKELVEFHQHVRRAQFSPATAPQQVPRRLLPPNLAEPPFVGRVEELGAVGRCAGQAFSQGGFAVGILGEPGMGKSRLCKVSSAALLDEKTLFLKCQGSRFEYPLNWRALREALQPCLTLLPSSFFQQLPGPVWQQLQMVLEVQHPAPHRGYAAEPVLTSHAHLALGVNAMLHAVIGHGRRLVWLIEDIQWVDRASLELMAELDLDGLPVLLLCSGDLNAISPIQALITRAFPNHNARIQLTPLSRAHVGELLEKLSHRSLPQAQVEQLFQQSAGNPLFLSTLLLYMFNNDFLVLEEDGRWRSLKSLPQNVLPYPMQEAIDRHLATLDPSAQQLLAAAAVLGSAFDLQTLHDMTDQPQPHLVRALDQLIENRCILEAKGRFSFSNAKIQEVVYEKLGPVERQQLHLKAAHALERKQNENAYAHQILLAHHYEQAKAWDKAYGCVQGALAQALQHYWVEESQSLLQRADQLLATCDLERGKRHLEILTLDLRRAKYLEFLGDRKAQSRILSNALESLAEVDAPRLAAQVHFDVSWFYVLTGRFRLALCHAFQALARWQQLGCPLEYAISLEMVGRAYHALGRYPAALCCFAESCRLLQGLGEEVSAAYALDNVGIAQRALADLGAAFQSHQRALASFRDHEDEFGQAVSCNNLAILSNIVGQGKTALKWAKTAYALHHKLGNQRGQALALQGAAFALALRGKFRRACRWLGVAQAEYERINDQARQVHVHYFAGVFQLKLEDPAAALSSFKQACQLAQSIKAFDLVGLMASWQSAALRRLGRIEEALCASKQAVGLLEQGFEAWPHLIHFHHAKCLEAAGGARKEVQAHLCASYRHLMQAARSIQEPALRQSFLDNDLLQEHAAIVAAHRKAVAASGEVDVETANVS